MDQQLKNTQSQCEEAGLIPDHGHQVKDLALLWLWHRPGAAAVIPLLYTPGVTVKRKENVKKTKQNKTKQKKNKTKKETAITDLGNAWEQASIPTSATGRQTPEVREATTLLSVKWSPHQKPIK